MLIGAFGYDKIRWKQELWLNYYKSNQK